MLVVKTNESPTKEKLKENTNNLFNSLKNYFICVEFGDKEFIDKNFNCLRRDIEFKKENSLKKLKIEENEKPNQ